MHLADNHARTVSKWQTLIRVSHRTASPSLTICRAINTKEYEVGTLNRVQQLSNQLAYLHRCTRRSSWFSHSSHGNVETNTATLKSRLTIFQVTKPHRR